MADAIPSNVGRIPEPQEKRNTAKPVRWRPEFGLDHPDAPIRVVEVVRGTMWRFPIILLVPPVRTTRC